MTHPYRDPPALRRDCPCNGLCGCTHVACGYRVTCPSCSGHKVVARGYEIAFTVEDCPTCWFHFGRGKGESSGSVTEFQCHDWNVGFELRYVAEHGCKSCDNGTCTRPQHELYRRVR